MPGSKPEIMPQVTPIGLFPVSIARRYQLMVFAFVAVVVILVVVMVMATAYIEQSSSLGMPAVEYTQVPITSRIKEVRASESGFLVTLAVSDIGERPFSVEAFGLGNTNNIFVALVEGELVLYNLEDDSKTFIELPHSVSGVTGETIGWSHNDSYFAFITGNIVTSSPELLIYSDEGLLIETVPLEFSADENESFLVTQFSPKADLILARVTDEEEKLVVINLEGEIVLEVSLEVVAPSDNIIYLWDDSGQAILYQVLRADQRPNYADSDSFTKVSIP